MLMSPNEGRTMRIVARLAVLTALVAGVLSTPRRAVADGPAGSPSYVAAAAEGVATEKVPAPAGQATKFLLPYYRSVVMGSGTPNTGTSLQVSNLNNATCDVSVQWLVQDSIACESMATLLPYALTTFCTRPQVEGPLSAFESCLNVCDPALTSQQGRAQVNISKAVACKKFALEARLIMANSTDTALIAMQDLKIVKPTGNAGD
jgi:hypothetical protein